jgi:hypothetical protein
MMAGFLAGVADGIAGLNGSLPCNGSAARKNRFEQRRFAALERANQRDAPGTRGSCAVLCPGSSSML